MKIMHVVGARPNFPKIAPIMAEMAKRLDRFDQVLVHTYNMSQMFFDQLDMPAPNECLNVGSGSHAAQTAMVMTAFEPVVLSHRPDWVLVAGDVNSTVACVLVRAKLQVRVAHVEAGLRSRDRTMPEEINRVVTDQIADLLFTPSKDGDDNLIREGTNRLVASRHKDLVEAMIQSLDREPSTPTRRPELWDGLAARRIADVMCNL